MIIDILENISRYKNLDVLKAYNESQYQKGKFSINKDEAFGIGIEYETKGAEAGLWEAHQKYLDVHLILEGEEKVHISEIAHCTPSMEYDAENDYQLFNARMEQEITLKKGSFIVLFPNEVHKTGVQVSNTVEVKKIVFKIEL